ncbi:hypothetical protein [Psychrobacter sp. I-STPA6b]|uniref:hypothetical protein n=1 Tax=Psychrobacter sp. I-STPA6b TaxID=2585718 RepID=UPI001D0CB40F|nr:hypothetical protein [Psychrobacter sp. I-STPA6b]
MRVIEAIEKWDIVIGTEIEVSGIAEISGCMSVIYDHINKKRISDPIMPGILVHGDQLATLVQSLPNPLPGKAGSEILYIVKVRILGIVANTGYTFAPLKFGHIYKIEFDDEYIGLQSLIVNERLKDIVFTIDRKLTTQEVKRFKYYFPTFINMVELKKHLESGQSLVLVSRVLESELLEHVQFLERLDIKFELNDSPIEMVFGVCRSVVKVQHLVG